MTPQNARGWLSNFFGGANQLRWLDVEGGTLPDNWSVEIATWLTLLVRDSNAAILLPLLDASGAVTWYAVGRTRRAVHSLAEDLGGFVGQTYGGFTGRPHEPTAAEPAAMVLAAEFPAPMYRIGPISGSDIGGIRRSLARYRRLIDRRPGATRLAARSVGALRSRFDRALLAGNESEAIRLHDEILASGRLSWDNRLYLRIRLLAGLGQWPEIARNESLLRQARDLSLPAQVRAEIVEALYRTFVVPSEDPANPAKALTAFEVAAISRHARLFSTRQDIRQPSVVKAFLLHALLKQPTVCSELEELASLLPTEGPEAPFSAALRALVTERTAPARAPVQDPTLEAEAAFENAEFDRALELFCKIPPTRTVIARILQCARLNASPKAAKLATKAVDAWGESPDTLPEALKGILADLRKQITPAADASVTTTGSSPALQTSPDDWLAWAQWVAEGAPKPDALRTVRERAATWSTEPYRYPPKAQEIADHLGNASLRSPDVIQAAFPHIFEAFVASHGALNPAWKPLYSNLLMALTLSSSRSTDDLELARVLTANLIAVGLDSPEYENLIRDLKEILTAEASLATLDWALDLAEVLVLNRATLPDARLSLIVEVLEIARTRAHRLTAPHIGALRMLCEDIAMEPPAYVKSPSEAVQEQSSGINLADRSIAIYTLAETAGQRAANLLRQLAPTARVSLNSDLVCTERLASLARNADLFIFAWRSSKHAAYYCVKDHRPGDKPILMPLGKGSASILRALFPSP
jgi:hypothetical protein